jgi:flavodoxin
LKSLNFNTEKVAKEIKEEIKSLSIEYDKDEYDILIDKHCVLIMENEMLKRMLKNAKK